MIRLTNDALEFHFPAVHESARCSIDFQRTLRIPDDERDYPLPPGLGRFPLERVDDFADRVPEAWRRHGGVFLPMYQAEALWLRFAGPYPCAVKVAAGKVNALTGEGWSEGLVADPQDYLVSPDQPWLDGFAVERGLIRQFVAMPLGEGYSAEEQITGEARHGGIQLLVYPMKGEVYEAHYARRIHLEELASPVCYSSEADMGLAPGGLMRQEVYQDDYGLDVWDQEAGARCFVHVVNSVAYLTLTGHPPPNPPPSAEAYTRAGLPWFDYYDADRTALEGAKRLAGLDSVATQHAKQGQGTLPDNAAVEPVHVRHLGLGRTVREGEF
jgi:hypothetical protein